MKFIKTALFIFVLVILATAVYMAYSDIMKNMPKKIESFSDDKPKLKICLYKAVWCLHCTRYLKSNVFDDTYADVKGKYNDVVFTTVDFDQNKQLAEKYNVNSFPTIIAVDADGKLIDTFDGDRSKKEELMKFVEANRVKV
jgi:thioredoxin-like negative regulator of GroEL